MSVYVKGLEMPKEGNWKTIRIYPDGTCVVPNWQGDCTVIKGADAASVPSHGRLIDADVLADVFRGFIAIYDSRPFNLQDIARRNELQFALAEVMKAPTIISASEDKQ